MRFDATLYSVTVARARPAVQQGILKSPMPAMRDGNRLLVDAGDGSTRLPL